MTKHRRIDSEHELRLASANISSMSKAETVAAYRGMLDACQAEGRSLTSFEERLADEYQKHLDRLGKMPVPARGIDTRLGDNATSERPSEFAYRDPRSGSWVRSVSKGESIAACSGEKPSQGPHLGEMIAGAITGRWAHRDAERAAVQTSVTANGGILVPENTASYVIDKARARMVCMAAGVKTITLPPGDSFKIGTLETDATASWRVEGGHITASNQTFGAIYMYPKTCAALIPVTREWLEDVANGADLIEQATIAALAVALDTAILRGSGGPQPRGILNITNVGTTAVGGAWTYDTLLTGMYSIWNSNGPDPSAVILSPASEKSRRSRKDGDGLYLVADQTPLAGVPFLFSTSCPSDEIYLGDFTRVLLGARTDWTVEILPAGTGSTQSGDTFNATTQLGAWLRVYGRFDVHCEKPEHMHVLTGVTNS